MSLQDTEYEPFTISGIPDLTGRVALVTGAYSPESIGYQTAYHLALSGATVYIGARSEAKAKEGIQHMLKEAASIRAEQLHPFVVDLGDLKAVQNAGKILMASLNRLDIIIHNAALLARPLDFSPDGVSLSFTTNHLAPFVLTKTLMPLLKKTAESFPGVRVVSVSSRVHSLLPTGFKFDATTFNAELESTELGDASLTRYAMSKLANLLFASHLQKVFDAEGIRAISISLNPGDVRTTGSKAWIGAENQHLLDGVFSPLEGALTSLFAATSPKIWSSKDRYGGVYLVPFGKIETPDANGQSSKLAEMLWEASEQVTRSILGQ